MTQFVIATKLSYIIYSLYSFDPVTLILTVSVSSLTFSAAIYTLLPAYHYNSSYFDAIHIGTQLPVSLPVLTKILISPDRHLRPAARLQKPRQPPFAASQRIRHGRTPLIESRFDVGGERAKVGFLPAAEGWPAPVSDQGI
jgi:hypothetical protein